MIVTAVCIFGCFSNPASAQVINLKPVEFKGKITSINPNSITFVATDKKRYVADIRTVRTIQNRILELGPPQFNVRGLVDPTFLKDGRGMFVRFQARVQHEKRVLDEIKELTIFTRDDFTEFGLLPPDDGVLPDLSDEGIEKAKKDAETDDKKGRKKKNKKDDGIQTYVVSGMLLSAKKKLIKVQVPNFEKGNRDFNVRLSDDAVVNLDINDLSIVKEGDAIDIKGHAFSLPQFFATEVEITIDRGVKRPLGKVAKEEDDAKEEDEAIIEELKNGEEDNEINENNEVNEDNKEAVEEVAE